MSPNDQKRPGLEDDDPRGQYGPWAIMTLCDNRDRIHSLGAK